jgi:hypothetical protein
MGGGEVVTWMVVGMPSPPPPLLIMLFGVVYQMMCVVNIPSF